MRKTRKLYKYYLRLRDSVNKLIPFFSNPSNTWPNEGVFPENMPLDTQNGTFVIEENSKLYPSIASENYVYALLNQKPLVRIYKNPIPIEKEPYLKMKRENTISSGGLNALSPDLLMNFNKRGDSASRITYKLNSNILEIWGSRCMSNKSEWDGNGKISSILDLENAQIYITFDFFDPTINLGDLDVTLVLNKNILIGLTKDMACTYKYGSSITYVFRFTKDFLKLIYPIE